MEAFERLKARVAPLDRVNVDTDVIIPKQFLKSIKRTGFGPYLFDAWRYLDHGEPGQDCSHRPLNPEFVLNQPQYQGARILLARANFGCGSSREHAVWALLDYGFRVVIAPSFADIFHNNCFKNGMLPVVLPEATVEQLFQEAITSSDYELFVDLSSQRVITPTGQRLQFTVDPFRKRCLLNGLDEIGLTLQYAEEIRAYETRRRREAPWLFQDASSSSHGESLK
jgi:3-isopropylmalate/(R)-2-methylmalate dehydratase small subunit